MKNKNFFIGITVFTYVLLFGIQAFSQTMTLVGEYDHPSVRNLWTSYDVKTAVDNELAGDEEITFVLNQLGGKEIRYFTKETTSKPYLEIVTDVDTYNINPSDDVFVIGGTSGDVNYASITVLKLRYVDGSSASDMEGWMRFDLASVSGTVSSATLKLKVARDVSSAQKIKISYISDIAWSESTLTFNNRFLTTGIEDMGAESEVSIYPNPANGDFIVANSNGNVVGVTVFDVNGTIVHTQSAIGENQITVNVGGKLSAGCYYVQIKSDQGVEVRKVLIN